MTPRPPTPFHRVVRRLAPALPGSNALLLAPVCALLLGVAARAADIALTVEEPSGVARARWPVTSGVPLAPGMVRDARAATLLDAGGAPVPLQTDILARWPDGSVRWLLLDFQADLAAGQTKRFTLRTKDGTATISGSAATTPPPTPRALRVRTEGAVTTIETGPMRIAWDAGAFEPFGDVWIDADGDGRFEEGERVTRGDGEGLFVHEKGTRRFYGGRAPVELAVEESGPLRACVRATGRHTAADGVSYSYVVRMHVYAGHPHVRCSHTFIVDGSESVLTSIEALGLAARLAPEAGPEPAATLGDAPALQEAPAATGGGARLFQRDENHFEIDGKEAGKRARGWAAVSGGRAGFALGVREFWQQWPKSLEARERTLALGLCPDFPEGLYDGKPLREESKLYYALRGGVHTFKTGVAKTHDVYACFFTGAARSDRLAAFFSAAEEPLLATCDPGQACASGAAGAMPPATATRHAGYDAWAPRALEQHLALREKGREYGLLNWGDWHGEREVNWGNLEYDLQHGLFLHYLRSGDRRFFKRAEQAARHHIDVDTLHAVNAHLKNPFGAPPVAGEIWLHSVAHTGGYYDTPELPVEKAYQMGHSANYGHVWISGDLDYYHLTGDRRARDVALRTADMMSSRMTGKVGTHIRTLGWPMILVLAAHEATGEARYLEAARRNWLALRESLDPKRGWVVRLASDHCLHPEGSTQQQRNTIHKDRRCEGNVPFMEGLTLCALARYHRATGDPEVLRAITVGIDQMIRECWQEDVKTFRYTACPLSMKTPYGLFMLSAEAMAYEARLTGNREHLRILREGFRAAVPAKAGSAFGKSLGQLLFFAPHALEALAD